MENKTLNNVILFARCEAIISGIILLGCLILVFADLLFHLAGGFLAVLGLSYGLLALGGLIAGGVTIRFRKIGGILNILLALVITWSELQKAQVGLLDVFSHKSVDYTYPIWMVVISVLCLIVAIFLVLKGISLVFSKDR